MKKQTEQQNRLDLIEKSLLESTRLKNEEIDEIVSDPKLFDSVLAKIATEEKQKLQTSKQLLFNWNFVRNVFVNYRIGLAASACIVLLAIFSMVFLFSKAETRQIAKENQTKINQTELAESEDLSSNLISEVKAAKIGIYKSDEELINENSEFKKKRKFSRRNSRTAKSVQKKNYLKPPISSSKKKAKRKGLRKKKEIPDSPQVAKQEKKIFYSLPFGANGVIESEHLEIVKTELSRSELFALGVNLQLENSDSKIKTELLVGEDGVARAIRVIENF